MSDLPQSLTLSAARAGTGPARWIPLLRWNKRYARTDLHGDLTAGLVTAILVIPQGMAFAMLAGLPPEAGLYAGFLPMLVYALLGTSRALSVGPVSVAAIMVAHAIANLPPGVSPLQASTVLALLSGGMLAIMGWARLGAAANLLSHAVLSGFTLGAVLLIAASQLPALTGIAPWSGTPTTLQDWKVALTPDIAVLLVGLSSIGLLVVSGTPLTRGLRAIGFSEHRAKIVSKIGPLFVIVAGSLAAWFLNRGTASLIATVGDIPPGLPAFSFSLPDGALVMHLLPSAALIGLVGYVESVSIANVLAGRERERIDPNQEMLALGAANLAAGVSGTMPVAGGFSRTMVNHAAGARTPYASVTTVFVVALVMVALTPWLSNIPKAALAAIILVAVAKLFDVRGAIRSWRYDRADGIALLVTFAGVLALGIETGLGLGILASFAGLVWRSAHPHVAEIGRVPGTEHYRNVRRFQVQTWKNLLILRVDENLTFANADWVESLLVQEANRPGIEHLVLVMSSVSAIDVTALHSLDRLVEQLREAGVALHLAEVKGPVMDRLNSAGFPRHLGDGRFFLTTHQAATQLGRSENLSS